MLHASVNKIHVAHGLSKSSVEFLVIPLRGGPSSIFHGFVDISERFRANYKKFCVFKVLGSELRVIDLVKEW